MSQPEEKGAVTVVSAVMRSDGFPDFAITQVEVTPEEYDNGVHYLLVEESLAERGYEEPWVHFDEIESPAFLHVAVREYLASDRMPAALSARLSGGSPSTSRTTL